MPGQSARRRPHQQKSKMHEKAAKLRTTRRIAVVSLSSFRKKKNLQNKTCRTSGGLDRCFTGNCKSFVSPTLRSDELEKFTHNGVSESAIQISKNHTRHLYPKSIPQNGISDLPSHLIPELESQSEMSFLKELFGRRLRRRKSIIAY